MDEQTGVASSKCRRCVFPSPMLPRSPSLSFRSTVTAMPTLRSLLENILSRFRTVRHLFSLPNRAKPLTIDGSKLRDKLTHVGEDGAFFIRGVRYKIAERIGAGQFGVVWRAKRDPDEPLAPCKANALARTWESLVSNHYSDWVLHLLNEPECCVKLVQVDTARSVKDVRREIELQVEAGCAVEGVLAILAHTPLADDAVGPVTVDAKWVENPKERGFLKNKKPCKGTHWAMIAVELADKGSLYHWISPLNKQGQGLWTMYENRAQEPLPQQAQAGEGRPSKASVFAGVDRRGAEDLARGVMYRLLTSVEALHRQNIYHLDIKPENIAIDRQWRVSLIDFGLSRRSEDPALFTVAGANAGTRGYRAPEASPGASTDIFAIGMTLFSLLLSCEIPFRQKPETPCKQFKKLHEVGFQTYAHRIRKLVSRSWDPHWPQVDPDNVSASGASLCMWMVQPEKTSRPTIAECLAHPWFSEGRLLKHNDDEWKDLVRQCLKHTGIEGKAFWLQRSGRATQAVLAGTSSVATGNAFLRSCLAKSVMVVFFLLVFFYVTMFPSISVDPFADSAL